MMDIFLLLEENDGATTVIGAYSELSMARSRKYALIREAYDISEDDISDEDLDAEIAPMEVYYHILHEKVIE